MLIGLRLDHYTTLLDRQIAQLDDEIEAGFLAAIPAAPGGRPKTGVPRP